MIECEEHSAGDFLDELDSLRSKLESDEPQEAVRAMARAFSMMGATHIPPLEGETFDAFRTRVLILFDEYCADIRPGLEQEYQQQRHEVVLYLRSEIALLQRDAGCGFSWERICAVLSLTHDRVNLVKKDLETNKPDAVTEQIRTGLVSLFRLWLTKLTKH